MTTKGCQEKAFAKASTCFLILFPPVFTPVTLYPIAMRSAALLRLAFGLLAVDSVVAGPCIPPGTTTAVTSTASTEASSTTAESTSSTVTTESSVETSSSTVSQSSTETSSSTISVETTATTDSTTTTGDMTTSTTSSAPTPTFSLVAIGGGAVSGNSLKSYDADNAFVLFRTDIGGGNSIRPYHIDSQGRLVNDQGFYLCGYYEAVNGDLDRPAIVVTCNSETPVYRSFLTCQLAADLKVTCSIPAIACVPGDPNDPWSEPDCQETAGTWDNLYTTEAGPGIGLEIGPPNIGNDYEIPVELGYQEV
ncbi:hypothetical protein CEP51_004015 [Fusarium floridanum]|uniref:Uncharacterized protein n=1 Tax=Fusarium floridanum TaxID=1325733 RepID=A0A428S3U9_9HYPO|nr:hypothetical protein CEP51_004015 [Fusarium floridanum]